MLAMDSLVAELAEQGVVAVLVIDRVEDAVPLARALVAGGIGAIELTLRTDAAIAAVAEIHREVPDILLGIGTVLTPQQVDQVCDAGARFAVAPGTQRSVIERATERALPFFPGVATPSDIEAAVALGCRVLKFFPAEASGGLGYLRSMAAPYDHLQLRYLPLGGIGPGNLEAYLGESRVLGVGGSWIAPRELIVSRQWETIAERAGAARAQVDRARSQGAQTGGGKG